MKQMTNPAALVLGAAFDPPHWGHFTMASEVLRQGIARQIYLVPCGRHNFGKQMSASSHRLAMTELLAQELNRVYPGSTRVLDLEITRDGISYAYDTLETLGSTESVGWLMGSDQLPTFHQWYRYLDLLKRYPVFVYPRAGYPLAPWYQEMQAVAGPLVTTSSSEVRAHTAAGHSIRELTFATITDYIAQHRMYETLE
jgi:nicotinate-nucleotide adenylyltransferase